jgi:HEAT repeat protein
MRCDHEQAKKVWMSFTEWDLVRHHIAGSLYEHDEIKEALELLERCCDEDSPLSQIAAAYILADFPERREDALAAYFRLEMHQSWYVRAEAISILFLLGKAQQAEDRAHALLRSFDGDGFRESIVEYLAGQTEEDVLLQHAGSSRKKQSDAQFHIAMKSLGEGDRDAALKHFNHCVDLDQLNRGSLYWAKAFQARLKNDQSWPNWIAPKEPEAELTP